MSILEKLKDLVAALESTETREKPEDVANPTPQTPESEPEMEISEEDIIDASEDSEEELLEIEELPAYLECSEEETSAVAAKLEAIKSAKTALGELVLSYEQKKMQLIKLVASSTTSFYDELNSLRLEYGIPEEGYTVQLPSSPSDKVSFNKD